MSRMDLLMDRLYRAGWIGRAVWWTIIATLAACAVGLLMFVLRLQQWQP